MPSRTDEEVIEYVCRVELPVTRMGLEGYAITREQRCAYGIQQDTRPAYQRTSVLRLPFPPATSQHAARRGGPAYRQSGGDSAQGEQGRYCQLVSGISVAVSSNNTVKTSDNRALRDSTTAKHQVSQVKRSKDMDTPDHGVL